MIVQLCRKTCPSYGCAHVEIIISNKNSNVSLIDVFLCALLIKNATLFLNVCNKKKKTFESSLFKNLQLCVCVCPCQCRLQRVVVKSVNWVVAAPADGRIPTLLRAALKDDCRKARC